MIPPYFISNKTERLPSDPLLREFKCCLISEGDFNLVPSSKNEGSAITSFSVGPI